MSSKKSISIIKFVLLFFLGLCFLVCSKPVYAKVKLNKKTVYLAPKMKVKLKVKGTRKKVTWKSSNKKIATVSKKGKVTAKKTGKVTITAKVKGKKLKCKIIVEKKARYNARKLRDFVVKKGEKYKDANGMTYYAISHSWSDEENREYSARIEAYKDKNKMNFIHSILPHTTAGKKYSYQMSIDLIKGSSGRFDQYCNGVSNPKGYYCWGSINTAFDGKGAGLKVSAYYNVDSGGGETAIPNPASKSSEIANSYAAAFKMYDKLLKYYKAGVTMNSIGFSKWK